MMPLSFLFKQLKPYPAIHEPANKSNYSHLLWIAVLRLKLGNRVFDLLLSTSCVAVFQAIYSIYLLGEQNSIFVSDLSAKRSSVTCGLGI